MNDVLKTMPEMIMGHTLDDKLCILPEYDETIRQKSIPERLIALQDIYQIFIPNKMSREIYSKLYLFAPFYPEKNSPFSLSGSTTRTAK